MSTDRQTKGAACPELFFGLVCAITLWRGLCEVCLYTAEFQRPHGEADDTQTAWAGLEE